MDGGRLHASRRSSLSKVEGLGWGRREVASQGVISSLERYRPVRVNLGI